MAKHDVAGREPREDAPPEPRDRRAGAPIPSDDVHDLSVPGGRPLCGAEPGMAPPARPAAPVSCPACARLVADDVRRKAHAPPPHAKESED